MVEPTGGSDGAVQGFLLGSALAACLQQRGIVTLHASAVETGAGAVLCAGPSGSGKSTLLAALVERGYRMLADDVTGVFLDGGGRPTALPAFPCARLWADAVDRIGCQAQARDTVWDGREKYCVPVERFCTAPLVLDAVFTLAAHDRRDFSFESLAPAAALRNLVRHTYRKRFLRGLLPGRQRDYFRTLQALGRCVPLIRVRRPAHAFRIDALADEVERRLPVRGPARADDRRAATEAPDAARTGPPAVAAAADGSAIRLGRRSR